MYFVSFQPYDWRTAIKKPGYKELYSEITGFNGMYCFPAERLDVAAINATFIVCSTPEIAVWFKTNDWFCIPKIEHYQYLHKGEQPPCFSRKFLIEQYKSDGHRGRFEDFLMSVMPYHFEFLVNRGTIQPIAEVDIKTVVLNAFMSDDSWNDVRQKRLQSVIDNTVNRQQESYALAKSAWMTQERAVRDGEATTWYRLYCMDNDLFIGDYKRIIGMKTDEQDITMKSVNMAQLDKLALAFDMKPTKKTFEAFVQFMEANIYKTGL